MHVAEPMRLSLGEWIAIVTGWQRAHGGSTVAAPSDDEFDQAVMAARSIA